MDSFLSSFKAFFITNQSIRQSVRFQCRHTRFFGDPLGIRTPDPLLKRQSPDSQGWGEPKTYCCSSTFRSSVFCVYVARPTVYPVFYYNRKNGIRQTFLSINRHLILEINYSKAIFNRDDKMFRKTLLPDTNIFLTTAEALP